MFDLLQKVRFAIRLVNLNDPRFLVAGQTTLTLPAAMSEGSKVFSFNQYYRNLLLQYQFMKTECTKVLS